MSIQLSSIIEVDSQGHPRAREDYGDLSTLCESIKSIGLIQPIILSGTILCAGGRRRRALELLGFTEVHEGVTCDPLRPGYVNADNIPEDIRLEIELDENLERLGFKWTEEVMLIYRTHMAKKRKSIENFQGWGYRQTGALLGVSYGHIQNVILIAELIIAGDKGILKATSLGDAIGMVMQRNEDIANKRLAEISGISIPDLGNITGGLQKRTSSGPGLNNIDLSGLGELETNGKSGAIDKAHGVLDDLDLGSSRSESDREVSAPGFSGDLNVPLSQMFLLGDSVRDIMPRMNEKIFDHIITDIPYGIPMENLDLQDQERIAAAHEVDENVDLMEPFLEQAYRTLKDQGYLIFWYDIEHHEKLMEWGKKVGFKVQRWPLIWCKLHNTKNQAPAFNFTKKHETAMVMRKGNATLIKPQTSSYILADGSIERRLYKNPFAKPFEVWKWLIDAVAIPGQILGDPFGGEFSFARTAINCGMKPISIEKEEIHYNRGLEGIKNLYQSLTQNKAVFS